MKGRRYSIEFARLDGGALSACLLLRRECGEFGLYLSALFSLVTDLEPAMRAPCHKKVEFPIQPGDNRARSARRS